MVLAARTGPTGEAAAAADSAQGSRREGKCPASTLLPQRLRQGLPQAELMQKTEGEYKTNPLQGVGIQTGKEEGTHMENGWFSRAR